jgi:hypothetical protein
MYDISYEESVRHIGLREKEKNIVLLEIENKKEKIEKYWKAKNTSDLDKNSVKDDMEKFIKDDFLSEACDHANLSVNASKVYIDSVKNLTNIADAAHFHELTPREYDAARRDLNRKKEDLQDFYRKNWN